MVRGRCAADGLFLSRYGTILSRNTTGAAKLEADLECCCNLIATRT
jgi:hypothetical protein